MTNKIHMQTDIARQHLSVLQQYSAEALLNMGSLLNEINAFISEGWWALGASEFSNYCDDWVRRRKNILKEVEELAQTLEKEIQQMEETGRVLGN